MRTSKLSLKMVNNIARQVKLSKHEIIEIIDKENSKCLVYKSGERSPNIRNFYEYYIDEQPLINIISKFYWTSEANENSLFFNTHIGCLGAFGLFWDQIYVSILTDKEFTQDQINKLLELFKSNYEFSKKQLAKQSLSKQIINEVKDTFLMYCCQDCGDSGCGGTSLNIQKRKNKIIWTDNEKIEIHFNKIEYEKVLQDFLIKRELELI